jgi:hypothetical protein
MIRSAIVIPFYGDDERDETMATNIQKTDDQWREELTPEQY